MTKEKISEESQSNYILWYVCLQNNYKNTIYWYMQITAEDQQIKVYTCRVHRYTIEFQFLSSAFLKFYMMQ
jgi:hypothetical protein